MPKVKLTTAAIERLTPPAVGQVDYFDKLLPGFALRLTANGVRSFVCFYRVASKLRRDTLGKYPRLTLAMARDKARAAFEAVAAGEDPRLEKQPRKAEVQRRSGDTYSPAVDDFIAKHAIAKKGNRRHREQKRLLLKANEAWHALPVSSIATSDINDALDGLMTAGKRYTANRTYEALGTFFRWLHQRDRVPTNPMLKVERPFDGEAPRERSWTDDELKAIWKAADALNEFESTYLQLLLLTGQRRGEVASIRRDELDLKKATWQLPASKAKGKRAHTFPLPRYAVERLAALPRIKDNPFVFPGRGTRAGETREMTIGSKIQARIREASGVYDFTFHDARRTFRTGLDRLGIAPHVKDECLNHARRGVGDRHYSTHEYLDEQREAFEAWCAHVMSLITPRAPAKVLPMRGKR
jgi:integrase